jgi:predicted cupin superfamily sugar epimerase
LYFMETLLIKRLLGVALADVCYCVYAVETAVAGSGEKANKMETTSEANVQTSLPSAATIARALQLENHVEGGYFRRTYQADHCAPVTTDGGDRYLMTSIYYMLTSESPVGHWHQNHSDILHFFHLGDPLRYSLIHPDGTLEQVVLGPDVAAGQQLQLLVRGGIWKSSQLLSGDAGYGLISEAVSPGFDYNDMTIGRADELSAQFPQHRNLIEAYSKK